MNLLLDTHSLIWAVCDTKKLPPSLRAHLKNPRNRILVSAVSFWEIAIKQAIGKLELARLSPDDVRTAALDMGFELLPLTPEDSASFSRLPKSTHKDPFDRMLVWQAIQGQYHFVSCDTLLDEYQASGLKRLWAK